MHNQFYLHTFSNLSDISFSPKDYSYLKFGSDTIAKKFGYQMADKFFEKFATTLIANESICIPSPYNHVKNAATILTKHFLNRLNYLLVNNSGSIIQYSVIHRKVKYTKDYGFLSAEQRKNLIDQDDFFFNPEFYKDKLLIFIDDVFITGTHERKLQELLQNHYISNECIFGYFGKYTGERADIEAEINFSGIKNLSDLQSLIINDKNHKLIVRPIKLILSSSKLECAIFLDSLSSDKLEALYYACLSENYYTIPSYQENFQLIFSRFQKLYV